VIFAQRRVEVPRYLWQLSSEWGGSCADSRELSRTARAGRRRRRRPNQDAGLSTCAVCAWPRCHLASSTCRDPPSGDCHHLYCVSPCGDATGPVVSSQVVSERKHGSRQLQSSRFQPRVRATGCSFHLVQLPFLGCGADRGNVPCCPRKEHLPIPQQPVGCSYQERSGEWNSILGCSSCSHQISSYPIT
jgi:hypothetical protein